uniref:Uncharacterized protein n=1 Tax=Ananas comosus var. bracteatus TaxID=296719 RepID=A0A6V7Q965_ANACO|nr:unnamed protein product [Ananas comosus var. bracteatus]
MQVMKEQLKPKPVNVRNKPTEEDTGTQLATGSPRGATTSRPFLSKQGSQKASCLCSPTKHAGSFRCRLHRSSLYHGDSSVGSDLSELANRSSLHHSDSSVGSDLFELSNKSPA